MAAKVSGQRDARSLRLLHGAALRLDVPPVVGDRLPEELRELIEPATLIAWQRTVDTAVERQVDAVLLCGDTLAADQASLPAEVAFRQGCLRLHEASIPVFVVPGRSDPAAEWERLPDLPPNVTVLRGRGDSEVIELSDGGRTRALLVTVGAGATEPWREHGTVAGADLFPPGRVPAHDPQTSVIGLTARPGTDYFGPWRASAGTAPFLPECDYLATGAIEATSALESTFLAAAHHAGAPPEAPLTDTLAAESWLTWEAQGLHPRATGAHGVWIVDVRPGESVRRELIRVAPLRWEHLVIELDGLFDREALLERMLSRWEELVPWPGERVRAVTWSFRGGESGRLDLDEPATADDLARQLRELTDQPKGIRAWHLVEPQGPDSNALPTGTHDLWHDYEAALTGLFPLEGGTGTLRRVLQEGGLPQVLASDRWDRWLDQAQEERIRAEARRLGWRWLTAPGGGRGR